jgi:formamidopyrimidine-DNA glycosylase
MCAKVLKTRKDKNICKLLMDQKSIVSGIGNYQLSEVLYRSGISPYRDLDSFTDTDYLSLYISIKKVVIEAYLAGGTSVKDYYNPDGKIGNYQHELQVYSMDTDPWGNKVTKEVGPHKRAIFWVKGEQV